VTRLGQICWVAATVLATAACATSKAPGNATYRETVLITGANRGIGFEFARQFAAKDWRVIATARRPDEATQLRDLAAADPDVIIEKLDVTDHAEIDELAAKYRGQPIDILLLNAALGPSPATAMSPLAKLDFDVGRLSFETNAIGPLKMAQAFMDSVAASGRKQIIAMGTDSGSFGATSKRPILYHYKASKTALHMYMQILSFEAPKRGVTVVILHPGMVGTNPNLARFPGALKTEDSVTQLMAVIDRLTPADNGRFISYAGEQMPW
jgi:NAD(P)-dependent dehydrogenase (short-subunit alcohol dehydrogenase family)